MIDKIPMMIDEKGQIVCLLESKNEPTINVIGQRGMGMSCMLHRMIDYAYWKCNWKIVILNDDRSECNTWCKPWEVKK